MIILDTHVSDIFPLLDNPGLSYSALGEELIGKLSQLIRSTLSIYR